MYCNKDQIDLPIPALVADKLFVLDVWVSLSATGLCFGTLFLLGHGVISRRPTPIASFRFSFHYLNMLRILSYFCDMNLNSLP